MELSVIIAVYDESESVGRNLDRLARHLASSGLDWEVLVVDDGSRVPFRAPDSLAPHGARVRVHRETVNRGQGHSVRQGVFLTRGENIVYMDADLSVPLEHLPEFLAALKESDVVVASRWIQGSRVRRRQPWLRRWLGRFFYLMVHALFLPGIHDTNCGFKAYRRAAAERVFRLARCDRWGFNVEHLLLARRAGLRIREVPVRWEHGPESHVRLARDVAFTLRELASIFVRHRLLPFRGGRG
jgi:glycosyltransferase involved in cell wall biosynthesis